MQRIGRTTLASSAFFAAASIFWATSLWCAEIFATEPSEAEMRKTLLSDEFFDDFYGAEKTTLFEFDGERFEANFATDPNKNRFFVDKPLTVDCSQFDRFAITTEIEDASAFAGATLYFRSGNGWRGCPGAARRGVGKTTTFVFDAKDWREEGDPAGLDQTDLFRFALWRGGAVDTSLVVRSLTATKFTFGVLDVDDDGGENGAIVSSFGRLLTRCGLDAGRLDANAATAESLRRYPVLFLPIAGKIQDETVDALCEYVDDGGFLFAFYNAPEKLIRKLGFLPGRYCRPAEDDVRLEAMRFDPKSVAIARERGFELPDKITQHSWNLLLATPNPDWTAPRDSAIFGDAKARTLADWVDDKGATTGWPAILASPSGFFCSHIFMSEDVDAQKKTLEAFVSAARPDVARRFLVADWREIFAVGVDPTDDVAAARAQTLDAALSYLAKKGWRLADVARFLVAESTETTFDRGAAAFDRARFVRFAEDVESLARERVAEYCRSRKTRTNEGRLWWEHSGTGIYPGDWDRTMKELADAGFNAVVPNMLWGGVAYYESDVLPRDPKVEKYGDQIAQAVAAGKKYGVETHVWKVCFNASNAPKDFLDKASAQGRLQRTFDGEEQPWLCPSNLENRALELASLEEVATKYDVDGIHFDYIRYPDGNCCFCDGCKERFGAAYKEQTGKTLVDFPGCVRRDKEIESLFNEWHCDQITALVRAVRESLKEKAPNVAISAAVFSGYPGTKSSVAQDWGKWVDEGLLDFVCPMDYTSDPAAFGRLVESQLKTINGKIPLYPGVGATATGIAMRPEEVVLQAEIARNAGAQGFTIFNLAKSTADACFPAFRAGATSEKTPFPPIERNR